MVGISARERERSFSGGFASENGLGILNCGTQEKSDVQWSSPRIPCLAQGYELAENICRMRGRIRMSAVLRVKLS